MSTSWMAKRCCKSFLISSSRFFMFDKIEKLIAVSLHIFNCSYELVSLFYDLSSMYLCVDYGVFIEVLGDKVWWKFFFHRLFEFFIDFLFYLISKRSFLIRWHVLACCYINGLYMCQELIRSLLKHHLFSIWYGSQIWDTNGIAVYKSVVGIQLKCDAIWNLLSSFCWKPIMSR